MEAKAVELLEANLKQAEEIEAMVRAQADFASQAHQQTASGLILASEMIHSQVVAIRDEVARGRQKSKTPPAKARKIAARNSILRE